MEAFPLSIFWCAALRQHRLVLVIIVNEFR